MTHFEPAMTPDMLEGLLDHVLREGRAASQRREQYQAGVWYAQGLSLIHQLGNHEETMSMILFYYGQVSAHSRMRSEAIPCLEAAARMQNRIGSGEAEADCLYVVGTMMAALGNYEQAHRHLGDALQCYQRLDNQHKIAATEAELSKVRAYFARAGSITRRYLPIPIVSRLFPRFRGIPIRARSLNRKLEFAISVDQEVVERFSVTVSGDVEWQRVRKTNRTIPMGLAHAWRVVCTNQF